MAIILTTPIPKKVPILTNVVISKVDLSHVNFDVDNKIINVKLNLLSSTGAIVGRTTLRISGADYITFVTSNNPTSKIGTSLNRLIHQYVLAKGLYEGTEA